jgi:CO/xanthine dehydrogenase Mo-binding subunit
MQDLLVGDHFPFATDKILYEGQELAAVAADTKCQALDALEAVEVQYEDLPAIVDPEQALRPDAPLIQGASATSLETATSSTGTGYGWVPSKPRNRTRTSLHRLVQRIELAHRSWPGPGGVSFRQDSRRPRRMPLPASRPREATMEARNA